MTTTMPAAPTNLHDPHAQDTPAARLRTRLENKTAVVGIVGLGYVDPKRIGITGGSYGGYLTYMAMVTRSELWAAGLALIDQREQRIRDFGARPASEGTDAR